MPQEELVQLVGIRWLGDVRVESHLDRSSFVFFLCPARDGDEEHRTVQGIVTKVLGERVAVHARHADVEQADMGQDVFCHPHGFFPAHRDGDVVPALSEERTQQLATLDIVVDDQDAEPPGISSLAHTGSEPPLSLRRQVLLHFLGRSTTAAALAFVSGCVPAAKPFC